MDVFLLRSMIYEREPTQVLIGRRELRRTYFGCQSHGSYRLLDSSSVEANMNSISNVLMHSLAQKPTRVVSAGSRAGQLRKSPGLQT